MQEMNSLNFTTSEQHKDLSKSRQDRDAKDIALVVSYVEDKNPFVNGEHLMNIADGVIAASNVNVDQAKSIGEMIMQSRWERIFIQKERPGYNARKQN